MHMCFYYCFMLVGHAFTFLTKFPYHNTHSHTCPYTHTHIYRYAILAPQAVPAGFMDGRKACELLLTALQLEANEYRLGNSKVRIATIPNHI